MQQPRPSVPSQLTSLQVLFRFSFRFAVLSLFANLGTQGFGATFSMLLAMSAIFCAIIGAMRNETIFGPVLTHWDEAALYGVLSYSAGAFA